MREKGSERERTTWSGRTVGGMDLRNTTTFFISHFPHDHSEKDLWRIFKRFGAVAEVFIAARLNRGG